MVSIKFSSVAKKLLEEIIITNRSKSVARAEAGLEVEEVLGVPDVLGVIVDLTCEEVVEVDDVSFEPSCECELSLGKGEGRGEGEGDLLDSILESLICSKISTSFACGDFNSRED